MTTHYVTIEPAEFDRITKRKQTCILYIAKNDVKSNDILILNSTSHSLSWKRELRVLVTHVNKGTGLILGYCAVSFQLIFEP